MSQTVPVSLSQFVERVSMIQLISVTLGLLVSTRPSLSSLCDRSRVQEGALDVARSLKIADTSSIVETFISLTLISHAPLIRVLSRHVSWWRGY